MNYEYRKDRQLIFFINFSESERGSKRRSAVGADQAEDISIGLI